MRKQTLLVRYEDLASDPQGYAKKIYQFTGLKFYGQDFEIQIKLSKLVSLTNFKSITRHIKEWIDDNTQSDSGGPYDTQRDSKKHILEWLDSKWLRPKQRKVKLEFFF